MVLDEADEMLNMGFYKDVRHIIELMKARELGEKLRTSGLRIDEILYLSLIHLSTVCASATPSGLTLAPD